MRCKCIWGQHRRMKVCDTCQPRVLIESPLSVDTPEGVAANQDFARACMLDSLRRGEAPFASHLLYTQVMNDRVAIERKQGIEAGLNWGQMADWTVVYTDLGISPGMQLGIDRAHAEGRKVIVRRLNPENPKHFQDCDPE